MRLVWPDTVVEESNLAQNVFTLRKVLGDSSEDARYLATLPRRGYRFVAEVRESTADSAQPQAAGQPLPPGTLWRARRVTWVLAALALASVAGPIAGYYAGRRAGEGETPRVRRLTYRRGYVQGARFAPDGRTVLYGAAWDGLPPRVFLTRPDSPESAPIDLPPAQLLSVSRSGELALKLDPPTLLEQMGTYRTLGRAPLTGGTPREVLEEVSAADWGPGGDLAIVRRIEKRVMRGEPLAVE